MPRTCIVVSHTHWDREWYEPFQRFRMRLVGVMDRLLEMLSHNPARQYFMLDGQTIVLKDYLQIRPEQEEALRQHVQDGRLLIGPWYLLPDEFLVSGEAIVRNLLLGDRMARSFGPKMMVGYIPDPFGHISQMPQILRGFGMDSAALRRGLDDQPTELLWQSPDGSAVLLCYLRDGYDNAARLPVHDQEALVREVARLRDSLAPHATTEYLLLMNGTDHMEPVPDLPQALAAAGSRLPDTDLVHGTLPMYVDAVKKSLQLDLREPLPEAVTHKLQVVQGELRSPKRHHLLPGVLSTRMWIKQRNQRIQSLLGKWAEPFAALAALTSDAQPTAQSQASDEMEASYAMVWQAWKYLLENHAHDSVCGCGIDQIHREMATRFDWAEQIAEEVARQSLVSIANRIDTRRKGPHAYTGSVPVVVFNPLSATRTDVVSASVQVPGSLEEFIVMDADGHTVPHQVTGRKGAEFASLVLGRDEVLGLASMVEMIAGLGLSVPEIHINSQAESADIDVTLIEHGHTDPALIAEAQRQIEGILANEAVQIFHARAHLATTVQFLFLAEDIPSCGYRTYFLARSQGHERSEAVTPVGACVSTTTETDTAKLHMENEFLAADVSGRDGLLTLLDKSTGAVFSDLQRFVDSGDRGDEYNYCPPDVDTVVSAAAHPVQVTWLEQGPVRWTVQVKQLYEVSASLSHARSERSHETVELPITSQISLCHGLPRLEVRTEVDNKARDHRLRVLFPTPVRTAHSEAESTFDVVRRPLGVPANTGDWVEQPVPSHPQQTFVDVSDGEVGLLVANRGLPEYEVFREQGGSATIALTLLRCMGWLSRDDYPCRQGHAGPAMEAPEAQCLGPATFEYALVPHAGTWECAYPHAHAFNAPLWAASTEEHDGTMPLAQSLITLQGAGLVLSAVKAAEEGNGLIVRFYNVGAESAAARVRTYVPILSAGLANLAEQDLRELEVDGSGHVTVEVKGKQIVTLRLRFGSPC